MAPLGVRSMPGHSTVCMAACWAPACCKHTVSMAHDAWMGTYVLGDISGGVKDSIHGVDVLEVHQGAVGQLPGLVELAPPEAGLKDVQGRHLEKRQRMVNYQPQPIL